MIIGISGKAGSGKDTVAGIIRELGGVSKNSVDWQIMKFAGKLKERIAVTWGINVKDLEDQEFKKQLSPLGITWRELMQKEGEKMREIDEDYWVKAAMSHYIPQCNNCNMDLDHCQNCDPNLYPSKWLITDVRYPNEAKAIKDKGGLLLRVNRGLTKVEINLPIGEFWYYAEEDRAQKDFMDALQSGKPINIPHHSETALDRFDKWDHVIENNGTIEELTEQVKQFLTKNNLT